MNTSALGYALVASAVLQHAECSFSKKSPAAGSVAPTKQTGSDLPGFDRYGDLLIPKEPAWQLSLQ